MARDKKELEYNTELPVGKRTVDKAPREFTDEHERALHALELLVNPLDTRVPENAMAIDAPHAGTRMSQRQLARKILAGRSYQAVQAWMNREPMPAGMAEWLLNDLQRIDNVAADRMVRVGEDEIAIVVKR